MEDIMMRRTSKDLNFIRRVVVTVAGVLIIAVHLLSGTAGHASSAPTQSSPATRFDVISVKRNENGAQERYVSPTPGRLSITNMTVKNLIMIAYGVRDFQVAGGPNWMDSDAY